MHKLEIKLKQHTPLIHFQHDQEGATLRASEVKPKLDKFIITRLGQGNYQTGIAQAKTNGWLIGKGDHPALDYKMRIDEPEMQTWEMSRDTGRTNQKGKPIFDTIPLFFGNIGNDNDREYVPKKMVFSKSPVNLTFSSANESLIEEVRNNLNAFFIYNNFGTRQSKGFGSFMLEGSAISRYLNKDYAKFSFSSHNMEFGNWSCFFELFTAIDYFYKTLRSGINQNGVYIKSLMYFYALDRLEYWDKRTIRYEFRHFTPDRNHDKGELADMKVDGENKKDISRLYRDMLGLASSQTWYSYNKDIITKEHVTDDSEQMVDRFKSPILIKPIYKNGVFEVLLIPSLIPDSYLNATFDISSKVNHSHFTMKTPKEFDVWDFLQFVTCQETYDMMTEKLKDIIDKAEQERMGKAKKIAKTLLSIYNSLGYVEK